MKLNEAIQKAQQNGLVPREITLGESWTAQVLLMPEFWQALGKSMGWDEEWAERGFVSMFEKPWIYHWHRLIDHLAEGKSIESFFAPL